MKRLCRPRDWIALLLGFASGLVVWMLPPAPTATVVLPPVDAENPAKATRLIAVSSDARFLITFEWSHDDASQWFRVWDRQRNLDKPALEVRVNHGRTSAENIVFSPDERTLTMMNGWDVLVFDVATAKKVMEFRTEKYGRVFFSADGKPQLARDYEEPVAHDIETGKEVRRFAKEIDGYRYRQNLDAFAIYRKDETLRAGKADDGAPGQIRVYSWVTGELLTSFSEPHRWIDVRAISRDGQVLLAHGYPPGSNQFGSGTYYQSALDVSTGAWRDSACVGLLDEWRASSPDGTTIARLRKTQRPDWLAKWWPVTNSVEVRRWASDERLASFDHAEEACFSPQGNVLAIQREGSTPAGIRQGQIGVSVRTGRVIDVYDLPFGTPWGRIAGAACLAAAGAWTLGWLCTRWRKRKTTATSTSPSSARI